MLNFDVVKDYLGIFDNTKDIQIGALIPSVLKFVSMHIGKPITAEDEIDEGLAFIVSKLIEYFMKDAGLKSYSLSRESTTFSDSIPTYLIVMLEPYKADTSKVSDKIQFFPITGIR
ncbi:hypothetical protein [Psychrobacillus sp. BM2]|uniref:hypothetical protein n=1 Tax=Psychrobacillus sp. BM2 TaxID=3400421 RepID=UPI003B014087